MVICFQHLERHIKHLFLVKTNDTRKYDVRSPAPTAGMVGDPMSSNDPSLKGRSPWMAGEHENNLYQRYIILQGKVGPHVWISTHIVH